MYITQGTIIPSQASFSFGADLDVYTLWKEYESKGEFTTPQGGYYVTGAAAASVTLGPGETKEVTIVLGWFFPDRDFLGLPVGRLNTISKVYSYEQLPPYFCYYNESSVDPNVCICVQQSQYAHVDTMLFLAVRMHYAC